MALSSSFAAALGFRSHRTQRVARRIESLCAANAGAPMPAVSVFRRAEPGALRSKLASVAQTPTARMWGPAAGAV